MPSRTRSDAVSPSFLRRLGEEIRSACRQVGNRGSERPVGEAPAHPIGEWLGTVRQPTGEFLGPVRAKALKALRGSASSPERWGDLTRTRVTRIKGERGSLHDAVTRDRGL